MSAGPRNVDAPASVARPSGKRRLAAAGALLALAAAVILVIAALLRSPGRLVLAVLLVILGVLAAWTALVQRGFMRVVGTVVAIAAVGGLIPLVVGEGSLVRLGTVIALMLVSGAATRIAVGRDLAEAPADAQRVPPAEHGVLIMNPRSGGGAVERHGLVEAARRRGITAVVMQPGDDLRGLAENAIAGGADVIGMAGGDGSQALVADVARHHGVPLVCVPAGTRNHFALDLGLDREDVPAALDAFGEAIERRIDLATVGDRVFVNNASLGVYATVVQSDDYRGAKMATTARLLPDLLGPSSAGFDLSYDEPGRGRRSSADLVLVSNNAYRMDGRAGSGTRPRLDTGELGVLTVTVKRGRHNGEGATPGMSQWTAADFLVDSAAPLVEVGVDGEALRLAPPLRFRALPGALRVRIPVDAPGVSPSAIRPDGVIAAARAVLRVLLGHPAR